MTFSAQYPVLIVVVPLLSAIAVSIAGMFKPRLCQPLTVLSMAATLYFALCTLLHVVAEGTISYRLGGWTPPFGIEYVVDHLNAMVLAVVALVGLLAAVYAGRSVESELPEKIPQFYTLYVLLVTGLLGITITGDAFNLYVLLEIAALTSYALIAAGRGRASLSSFNYLIMGTIGACFYLLGVGHLYIMTGSLNMPDLYRILAPLYDSVAV